MLPLVVPGIMTVCIYTFLFSWTEFLAALTFLTSQDLFTMPIALFEHRKWDLRPGELQRPGGDGAVIAAVPAIVVYLALQQYCVAGFLAAR